MALAAREEIQPDDLQLAPPTSVTAEPERPTPNGRCRNTSTVSKGRRSSRPSRKPRFNRTAAANSWASVQALYAIAWNAWGSVGAAARWSVADGGACSPIGTSARWTRR